jgi:hypothetical protein
MTEELKVDEPKVEEKVVEKAEEVVVVEVSPTETLAMDQGWVPLADWEASGRPKDEWRPAKEFVERGELYKSIHSTKRELKQTQAALTALQRHHQYVFEKAHVQAVRDLRAEKRLALRDGDIDRMEEIETELETITDQHAQEKAQIQSQNAQMNVAPAPEFVSFVERNPWYLTNQDMHDEADAAGFVHLNKGGSKETLFSTVEKKMREKFPEKFGVKRAAPNAVAAVNRTSKPANKVDFELSPEERDVMRTFIDMGIMTEAQYVKELKGKK